MNDIKHEIVRDIGILSENSKTGWRKMLRIVKWNGGAEKYDLHDWASDDSKSGKSGTLTAEEAKTLIILNPNIITILRRSFCALPLSPKLDVAAGYACAFASRQNTKILTAFLALLSGISIKLLQAEFGGSDE